MEETISLQEIFEIVKKRFKLIILMTIGAALIAAGVSYFLMTPIYQSSGQFIVNQNDSESNRVDSGTIRTNVELIKTYENIISSDAILNDVIEELNLSYSASKLDDKIQISNDQGSQVVTLTVKDPSPTEATEIANTTLKIFKEKIPVLMNMDVDSVHILSEAVTSANPTPVDPKPKLNIAIAVVLGLMVGVGLAFLLEYLNTTINTEEDVENHLDIPLLGVITTIEQEDVRPVGQLKRE